MSSTKKSVAENWLLVDWHSGGRDVVYLKAVVNPVKTELNIGDALIVNRGGEKEAATLVARARDRDTLDAMMKGEDVAGPSQPRNDDEEEKDYSSSASSWVPSDNDAPSGDSGAEDAKEVKKIKLERYKRQYSNRNSSQKILTPSNKVDIVLKIIDRMRKQEESQKNASLNKSIPDAAKKNQKALKMRSVESPEIKDIKNTFTLLFGMLKEWKHAVDMECKNPVNSAEEDINQEQINENNDQQREPLDDDKENEMNVINANEEFDRSDDNVLISNKYDNAGANTVERKEDAADKEWVPIGTGQTLIHKDKFKKVNWKSYTIATRTLLLAAFPRRILATHCLTGKRSPAFQDKPAKMCLDPKITSDVIIEIMDRFNVRENLVRSIITTKCADECKMWKTRMNKKKSLKNQENDGAGPSQAQ